MMNDSKSYPLISSLLPSKCLSAGFNLVFGWTKISRDRGLMLWPSVVSEFQAGLQSNCQTEPGMLVNLSGCDYQVGEGAAKFGMPLKALHRNFANTEVYKTMMRAALQRLDARGTAGELMGVALNSIGWRKRKNTLAFSPITTPHLKG